jgi:hypothetical protein
MGVLRIRDAAYPDHARRETFDKIYEMVSTSLFSARDTAKEIHKLWEAHAQKVTSGTCVRRTAQALHIDESIDRELRKLTESFLNASVRLGVDIGFWFQKQQAFDKAAALLAGTDPLLADYLIEARRAWSASLVLRRNAVEHEGWALPKVVYRDEAGAVFAAQPDVDASPSASSCRACSIGCAARLKILPYIS